MSTEQLKRLVLALPVEDRVQLAQELWASVENERPSMSDAAIVEEALERSAELDADPTQGKSHEDAMRDLRRNLRCG